MPDAATKEKKARPLRDEGRHPAPPNGRSGGAGTRTHALCVLQNSETLAFQRDFA